MSYQTAKLIIKRNGLECFTLRELSDLLRDRFNPLGPDVRQAIQTMREVSYGSYRRTQAPQAWALV